MIIRNNKDNLLFKPGYAFVEGKIIKSNAFLNDNMKSREEIEKEDFAEINKIIEESFENVIDKIAPTKLIKEKIKLGIFSFLVLASLLMISKNIYMPFFGISALTFTSIALLSVDKIIKFNKIKNNAANSIIAMKTLEDKKELDKIAPTVELKNKAEMDIVIDNLKKAPYHTVYDKLGISLKEKIEKIKEEDNNKEKILINKG